MYHNGWNHSISLFVCWWTTDGGRWWVTRQAFLIGIMFQVWLFLYRLSFSNHSIPTFNFGFRFKFSFELRKLQAMAFAYLWRSQLEKFWLAQVTLISPVSPRDSERKKLENIFFKLKTSLGVKMVHCHAKKWHA